MKVQAADVTSPERNDSCSNDIDAKRSPASNKRKQGNSTLQGLSAITGALKRVALDELPGGDAKHIPTKAKQLQAYLALNIGGEWTVESRHTDGVSAVYYTALPQPFPCTLPTSSASNRLFIKLAHPSAAGRINDAGLTTGACEVQFYNEVLRGHDSMETLGLHTPKCILAKASKHASRYIVVLEELDKNTVRMDKPGTKLPVHEVRLILDALGKMHAKFWGLEDAVPDIYKKRNKRCEKFVNLVINKAIKQQSKKGGLVPPGSNEHRIVTATQAMGGPLTMDMLLDDLHPNFRTLCHGDAHGGNVYFLHGRGKEEKEVGLLDWQTFAYANPIRDVTTVMICCLSVDDFINHRAELMQGYLNTLNMAGIEANITMGMVDDALCLKICYYCSVILLALHLVNGDKEGKEMIMDVWKDLNEKAKVLDVIRVIENYF